MAVKVFNINVRGYWKDRTVLPSHSGIYFVYVCTYNQQANTVMLKQLIYIGESEDVNNRVMNHEKYNEWLKYLSNGEELCFSTVKVENSCRVRVEAAYIFKHEPPVNTEYINSFQFDQTTIISNGEIASLGRNFTVYRTNFV